MRKKYLGIYISPGMPTKEECRVEQDKKKREDEANNSWAKILDSADAEKRFEE